MEPHTHPSVRVLAESGAGGPRGVVALHQPVSKPLGVVSQGTSLPITTNAFKVELKYVFKIKQFLVLKTTSSQTSHSL